MVENKKYLKENNIHFYTKKDRIIISKSNEDIVINKISSNDFLSFFKRTQFNNNGSVYINHIWELPEGLDFNNKGDVYLEKIITIPKNFKFNNRGYVSLDSLKNIPEGVDFNNGKDVFIPNVTEIAEGVKFKNGGDVDLYCLTELPKGVDFNNIGGVYILQYIEKQRVYVNMKGRYIVNTLNNKK